MKTILKAVATANPGLYVTQKQACEIFESRFNLSPDERDLYRKVLLEGPIRGRYVGLDSIEEAAEGDQDRLVARFLKHGRLIATQATVRALEEARVKSSEIGGVVVNTCTGYLCPGLSSYIAEGAGLGEHVRPLDIMGMGCGAALPNLQAADNMASADGGRPVVSVAVEICSATLFMDPDPGVVISNCIFGDGAAAAVVQRVPDDADNGLLRLVDYESGLYPRYRAHLQYRTEQHKLRNVLARDVPVIGARAVLDVTQRLLDRNGLSIASIDRWIVHPGGTQVLNRVAEKLGIERHALRFSYEVFAEFGNMSSPTVLFVLRKMLKDDPTRPGEKGVMLSFGAGFSAFAALVEF